MSVQGDGPEQPEHSTDANLDLDIDLEDLDDTSRSRAARTFQTEADYEAQRASYRAKFDNGNVSSSSLCLHILSHLVSPLVISEFSLLALEYKSHHVDFAIQLYEQVYALCQARDALGQNNDTQTKVTKVETGECIEDLSGKQASLVAELENLNATKTERGALPCLDKPQTLLISAAVAELYNLHRDEEVIDLLRRVGCSFELESMQINDDRNEQDSQQEPRTLSTAEKSRLRRQHKFCESMQRWTSRCEQRLAQGDATVPAGEK